MSTLLKTHKLNGPCCLTIYIYIFFLKEEVEEEEEGEGQLKEKEKLLNSYTESNATF